MRRAFVLAASTMMLLGLLANGALARGGSDWGDVPPHGHVMLQAAQVVPGEEGATLEFRRCVEFDMLRTPAHHHSIHTGRAGGSPFAQGALLNAGNWVAPLAPLTPWTGCDSFTSGMPFP